MSTPQGFPQYGAPFVDNEGRINQTWLQLLISLWQRTGAQQGGSTTGFAPGDLKPIAGPAIPSGWLLCDGSAVSRAVYGALFSAIGTRWGGGDGGNTFNLPDLRGRSPIGASTSHPLGSRGGTESVTISVLNLPAHSHAVSDPGHTHAITDPGHAHAVTDPGHTHAVTDPGHTHSITDPGHHHTAATTDSTATTGTDPGSAISGDTGDSDTGITVDDAFTGVSNDDATTGVAIDSNTTGVANNAATTGIATQDTGGGAAMITISPYAAVQWLIKT